MSLNYAVNISLSVKPTFERDISRKTRKAFIFSVLQNVDLIKSLLTPGDFLRYFLEIEWPKGIIAVHERSNLDAL